MPNKEPPKYLKDAVTAWAQGPEKPGDISEAILVIQKIVGGWEMGEQFGINHIYQTQYTEYFSATTNDIGDWIYEGNVDDDGEVPPLQRGKKVHKSNRLHKQQPLNKGVMAIDIDNGANAGHWEFIMRTQDVPDWFWTCNVYTNRLETTSIHRDDDYCFFGTTLDYLQPWDSNAFCQTTALMFAKAFNGDSNARRFIERLDVGNQVEAQRKYSPTRWGQQYQEVVAWAGGGDNVFNNAFLYSEIDPNVSSVFMNNWMQNLLFLEQLAFEYNPSTKLQKQSDRKLFRDAVKYLSQTIKAEQFDANSLTSLVRLCTYDK